MANNKIIGNVIAHIPYGMSNAISRVELVEKMKVSDRKVRDLIAQARRDNVIINLQNGQGYFQPTEQELHYVEEFISQETARFKSIAWSLRAAKKFARKSK